MKKFSILLVCVAMMIIAAGCSSAGTLPKPKLPAIDKDKYTVGEDINDDVINEFYYTIENINLDAYYLRYKFYVEDGKHIFFFEERERPGDYGPTTEEDKIAGTKFELTDKEWEEFFKTITGGTVQKRDDDPEDGGKGPWTYLYWTGDEDKYQEYSFISASNRKEFEELCESLVKKSGTSMKSEEEKKNIPEDVHDVFEKFITDNFTASSQKESFVTKRDDDGIYYTEYPVELFGVIDHYIGDLDDDGEDEMLVISLENEDVNESMWLSIYEYNDGTVELADMYEYGEKILEPDGGNTFVFLYRHSNYPVIAIMTEDYYYTRADGMDISLTVLNYADNELVLSDSDEYLGSDMEDDGFSKVFKRNGIDITWDDLSASDIQDRVLKSCDGKLLAELILGIDSMDEEDYMPVNIYRYAELKGYCQNVR